ncbi:MAG: hypothetical protein Q9208_003394 [Pyrenodesmia sp. 3 TL-2023]
MRVYLGDDSGINPQPHPQSNVTEKNRYYYQNRRAIVGFFNGPGLKSMGNRFVDLLIKEIATLDLGQHWTEREDLYTFVQKLLIGPAVEAMCGPILLDQNPDFGDNFWQIDHDIYYFFKAYPKWLALGAYRNRSKLLNDVKRWHILAREQFESSKIELDGHDPFYGSPLMRTRQQYLANVDGLDADAIASQDLGLLWAENANSIPAIFWMIYEALQRPQLLSKALEEIIASQSWTDLHPSPTIDIEALCSMPVLQSMYAETLRLYTSLFALRSAAHGNLDIANFTIPRDELIAVDSRVCAMDSETWNTGSEKGDGAYHPLDQFWAERFLVHHGDRHSGPLRFRASGKKTSGLESSYDPGNGPHFTMDGLAGAWIPFGGGNRQCPGRNFAKQEMIIGFTLVLSMLDVELASPDSCGIRKPNLKYYGLGTLPPKGKVPFRVRKRV